MAAYVLRRLAALIASLWAAVTLVFLLFQIVPGNPALVMAGPSGNEQQIQRIQRYLGLDKPVPVRYWDYLWGLVHGNLGWSVAYQNHLTGAVLGHLPATAQLAVQAIILATVLGIGTGVLAAAHHGSWLDHLLLTFSVGGAAIPNFWLGLVLIYLFAVEFQWVPIISSGAWTQSILPTLTLALFPASLIGRMTRTGMLEVLRSDYVRTARSKGGSWGRSLWRHALPNGLIPTLTVIGLMFGNLLGGSVVVETVFAWPGLGQMMLNSINLRDYPAVQATALLFAILMLVVNLIVDLAYGVLDPRIRYD